MYVVLLLLAAAFLFRRPLAQALGNRAELAGRVTRLRKAAADFLLGKDAPRAGETTRPQPSHATRPAPSCHPQLKYVAAEAAQDAPHCVSISRLPFRVGSARNCDLCIDDATLSHAHFEIFARGECYGVRNLSETNGLVLVNEQTQRIGARLKERGLVQMVDPARGYLRFWAGGQFFQLSLADFRAPELM